MEPFVYSLSVLEPDTVSLTDSKHVVCSFGLNRFGKQIVAKVSLMEEFAHTIIVLHFINQSNFT